MHGKRSARGRQIAYEIFFADKFAALQEQLKAVYGQNKSPEQIARDAQQTIVDFYHGIGTDMQQAQAWMEEWQRQAKSNGFDLWNDNQASGVSGQLKAEMTEGTASQLVGLWNMTAMDIRALKELTVELLEMGHVFFPDIRQLLAVVILIEENTRATAENTAEAVKELGEGFKQMGGKLDTIATNTKETNSRR